LLCKFAVSAICTTLLCSSLVAQDAFWSSPDAYLKQPRPEDIPRVFAPTLLADPGTFTMGRIAFSDDGRDIYYTQTDSWRVADHLRIKQVRYQEQKWQKPTVFAEQFVTPTLSIDGNAMYMRTSKMDNVWQSVRIGDGWTAPALLLQRKSGLYDFMPTRSGNVYVGSDPNPEDIHNGSTYVFSTLSIAHGVIASKSLGRPMNEPGFNGDLYVAPDESFMIVSAKETKDFESELYIAFRKPDATWTKPISLGPKINQGLAHRWGQYVSPDGKYLFYSYGRSEKNCAIYWVRFDTLLGKLRKEALPEG